MASSMKNFEMEFIWWFVVSWVTRSTFLVVVRNAYVSIYHIYYHQPTHLRFPRNIYSGNHFVVLLKNHL